MLPPRRHHLFRLWRDALSSDTLPQFDRWLSEAFRRNSQFGSRDRKWYSEMLFAAVRFGYLAVYCNRVLSSHRGNLNEKVLREHLEKFASESDSPDNHVALWRDIPAELFFQIVAERYRMGRGAEDVTPLLEGGRAREIMELLEALSRTEIDFALLFASVPLWFRPWFFERVERSGWSSERATQFLACQNVRPPLWLRVNHPERLREVVERLESQKFVVTPRGTALQVAGAAGIAASDVYREGLVEVQDLASQMAGSVVAAKPGDIVWDACAGGGGKTLQIASRLENRGAVYASDVREYKLDEVRLRARRAGFFNVRRQPWDGLEIPDFQREVQKRQGFDWVLVDAPCSAAGTWRRNPDAKYRINVGNVQNLTALQLQILKHASRAVAPGGHLVYATCSWLVAENEGLVASFLEAISGFEVESMDLFGNPGDDADTLFAARFRRIV